MSSTRMRPLEARKAALRAAKNPGCGCGHAHGPAAHATHADHEPQMTQMSQMTSTASVSSAPSVVPSSVTKQEAA